MELISSAFRIAFRDYCSDDLNLLKINNIFSGAVIQKGEISAEKLGTFSGQRRTLVEEYYASLDWTSHSDVEKFLKALSNFFNLYGRGEDNPIRERLQEEALLIDGFLDAFTR